jgi:hypothetical protein
MAVQASDTAKRFPTVDWAISIRRAYYLLKASRSGNTPAPLCQNKKTQDYFRSQTKPTQSVAAAILRSLYFSSLYDATRSIPNQRIQNWTARRPNRIPSPLEKGGLPELRDHHLNVECPYGILSAEHSDAEGCDQTRKQLRPTHRQAHHGLVANHNRYLFRNHDRRKALVLTPVLAPREEEKYRKALETLQGRFGNAMPKKFPSESHRMQPRFVNIDPTVSDYNTQSPSVPT